jgi:hypothetical protein
MINEVRPSLEILANGLDALDWSVLSDQERKCPQGVHSQELGSKTGIGFGIGNVLHRGRRWHKRGEKCIRIQGKYVEKS